MATKMYGSRKAITVRLEPKLTGPFMRYAKWREKTSGIKLSKQKLAEELILFALHRWLDKLAGRTGPEIPDAPPTFDERVRF